METKNGRIIKVSWRITNAGGLTIPIAFKLEGFKLSYIRPIAEESSNSGTHGMYYYSDVDLILQLIQSNKTLHRYVQIHTCNTNASLCEQVKKLAYEEWVLKRKEPRRVVDRILSEAKP